MDKEIKKKNILDLQFQKNLIIASTTVIIMFTYLIGVGIALITKQIELGDSVRMWALFIISAGITGIGLIFFYNAYFHIRNIPDVLKNL